MVFWGQSTPIPLAPLVLSSFQYSASLERNWEVQMSFTQTDANIPISVPVKMNQYSHVTNHCPIYLHLAAGLCGYFTTAWDWLSWIQSR